MFDFDDKCTQFKVEVYNHLPFGGVLRPKLIDAFFLTTDEKKQEILEHIPESINELVMCRNIDELMALLGVEQEMAKQVINENLRLQAVKQIHNSKLAEMIAESITDKPITLTEAIKINIGLHNLYLNNKPFDIDNNNHKKAFEQFLNEVIPEALIENHSKNQIEKLQKNIDSIIGFNRNWMLDDAKNNESFIIMYILLFKDLTEDYELSRNPSYRLLEAAMHAQKISPVTMEEVDSLLKYFESENPEPFKSACQSLYYKIEKSSRSLLSNDSIARMKNMVRIPPTPVMAQKQDRDVEEETSETVYFSEKPAIKTDDFTLPLEQEAEKEFSSIKRLLPKDAPVKVKVMNKQSVEQVEKKENNETSSEHSLANIQSGVQNIFDELSEDHMDSGDKRIFEYTKEDDSSIGEYTEMLSSSRYRSGKVEIPALISVNKFPLDGTEADKVRFSMYAATQLLSHRNTPPSPKDPLVLRGRNLEAVRYLWTALVKIGGKVPGMKFDHHAIKIRSTSGFLAKKELKSQSNLNIFSSKYKDDSLYNTVFKENEGHCQVSIDLLKEFLNEKKERNNNNKSQFNLGFAGLFGIQTMDKQQKGKTQGESSLNVSATSKR